MDKASCPYRVHQCLQCLGDTEYYCVSCLCDLCPQCKDVHVKDLKTVDHNVVSYPDKMNYIPTQEIFVRHPSKVHTKYYKPCQVPVCNNCKTHKKHKKICVQKAFETKRQHRGIIYTIRSDALFYRPVLLTGIKADFKTCRTEFSLFHQSDMLRKAQKLKDLIDYMIYDILNNVFCDFDFKHRCLKQTMEMNNHIVDLQGYEHRYEQPAFTFSALQFLFSIKTALPQIHLTLHTSQLCMTASLKKEDIIESLSAIQFTERGNRRVRNQCVLKLMSAAEFHQSLKVTGVGHCYHISCVTLDRVWVSDHRDNLILTNTTGDHLHCVENSCSGLYGGLHTVNSESELIYIDQDYNINKLSKDMKTTTTFIKRTYSTWDPWCLYWSPSTGNLLVGMYRNESCTGKVTRYNDCGQITQTIQHDNTGRRLYRQPLYIAENNNGDVLVSDFESGAVVVTGRGGRHRFSYTGHPSGSGLSPLGICTDALSHILVCDWKTDTVHMLDMCGQFLSHLLTKSQEMGVPCSLSYDVNTHCLWVGSLVKNKVFVFRYINRQDALIGEHRPRPDGDALSSLTPAVDYRWLGY